MKRGALFLIVAAAVLIFPMQASACGGGACSICWAFGCNFCFVDGDTTYCSGCGGVELQASFPSTLEFLNSDQTRARLSVFGYETTEMVVEGACVTAFPAVEGVRSVDAVRMVRNDNGETIEALEFLPNAVAGGEFAALVGESNLPVSDPADWYGFFSQISQNVPDGIPVHFQVDLSLEPGVNPRVFLETLRNYGVLGSGAGNLDGTVHLGHEVLRPLAKTRLNSSDAEGPQVERMPLR